MPDAPSSGEVYDSYADVIRSKEVDDGMLRLVEGSNSYGKYLFLSGVNYIKLLDMNRDGTDELIIAYNDQDSLTGIEPIENQRAEIYTVKDSKAENLFTGFTAGGRHATFIYLVKNNENLYFIDGDPLSDSFWFCVYGFDGDRFCIMKDYRGSTMENYQEYKELFSEYENSNLEWLTWSETIKDTVWDDAKAKYLTSLETRNQILGIPSVDLSVTELDLSSQGLTALPDLSMHPNCKIHNYH